MKFQQHGDVIIGRTKSIPEGAKLLNHLVVMEGEVTGHRHQIIEGEAQLYEKDGVLYLKAKSDCKIGHEEHGIQTITKGNYKIGRVVEYDPFEDAIRSVKD